MSGTGRHSSPRADERAPRRARLQYALVACAGVIVLAVAAFALARIGLASTKHQAEVLPRDPVASEATSDYRYMWGAAGTDTVSTPTYELAVEHDTGAFEGDELPVTATITSISPEVAHAMTELGVADSPDTHLALGVECQAFTVPRKDPSSFPFAPGRRPRSA